MTNLETIRIITENLRKILKETEEYFKLCKIKANIYYKGEAFEHGYGGKAYYINANFRIEIYLQGEDLKTLTSLEQEIGHKIREGMTLENINGGGDSLEGMTSVTKALVNKVEIEKNIFSRLPYEDSKSALERIASYGSQSTMGIDLMIRYKEK